MDRKFSKSYVIGIGLIALACGSGLVSCHENDFEKAGRKTGDAIEKGVDKVKDAANKVNDKGDDFINGLKK